MPAAGAIGAIGGALISAQAAGDAADEAASASGNMVAAQLADLNFRKKLYADFLRDYDAPLLKPLREKAAGEGPMDLGQNWAAIQRNFDVSGRNIEKNLARAGMTGSGYTKNAVTGLEMGRATALSDAYQKGLQNRDAMRMALGAMGKNMPQQATNLSGGYQNMAATYGGQAGMYGAQANQGWGNAAAGFSSGLQTIGQNWDKWFGSGAAAPAPSYNPEASYSTPGTSTATQARLADAAASYAPPTPAIPQAKLEAQDYYQNFNPYANDY